MQANAAQTPAFEFGNLSLEACLARAEEAGVPLQLVTEQSTPGIAIPVRLTGPLHGVTFHANSSDAGSPYEILDCRLALALNEFARILAAADVTQVVHYSMYRPPRGAWAASRLGGQHAGGLAIDVAELVRNDGTRLSVLDDFSGRIGAVTCGPRARPRRKTEASLLLRKLLCDTLAEHLFHVVLTPNHNRAHRNHFHMEVMAHKLWFYVE